MSVNRDAIEPNRHLCQLQLDVLRTFHREQDAGILKLCLAIALHYIFNCSDSGGEYYPTDFSMLLMNEYQKEVNIPNGLVEQKLTYVQGQQDVIALLIKFYLEDKKENNPRERYEYSVVSSVIAYVRLSNYWPIKNACIEKESLSNLMTGYWLDLRKVLISNEDSRVTRFWRMSFWTDLADSIGISPTILRAIVSSLSDRSMSTDNRIREQYNPETLLFVHIGWTLTMFSHVPWGENMALIYIIWDYLGYLDIMNGYIPSYTKGEGKTEAEVKYCAYVTRLRFASLSAAITIALGLNIDLEGDPYEWYEETLCTYSLSGDSFFVDQSRCSGSCITGTGSTGTGSPAPSNISSPPIRGKICLYCCLSLATSLFNSVDKNAKVQDEKNKLELYKDILASTRARLKHIKRHKLGLYISALLFKGFFVVVLLMVPVTKNYMMLLVAMMLILFLHQCKTARYLQLLKT